MNEKMAGPILLARQRARRLRLVAIIVLVAGVISAGVVYWLETRSPDLRNNPAMLGFNRAETRQMEQLYGKQGELIEQWTDDLRQPETQAGIIVAAAVIFAAGCLYFARLFEHEEEPD
jgi:hypothetical protein